MTELRIGRSKKNEIFIDDNSVSNYHAILIISQDEYAIVDHNSTNGTFVNGNKVNGSQKLKTHDILKVGNTIVPWRNFITYNLTEDEFFQEQNNSAQNQAEIDPVIKNKPGLNRRTIGFIASVLIISLGLFWWCFFNADSNKIMHRWKCNENSYGILEMDFKNKTEVNIIQREFASMSQTNLKARWHLLDDQKKIVIKNDSDEEAIYEYRITANQLILLDAQNGQVRTLNKSDK
jgi:hypothetical protein